MIREIKFKRDIIREEKVQQKSELHNAIAGPYFQNLAHATISAYLGASIFNV